MSDEIEPAPTGGRSIEPLPNDRADILRGNVFGIVASADDVQTKIARMLSLVPMALEVMDEARDTIQRLNEENERLRKKLEDQDDDNDN